MSEAATEEQERVVSAARSGMSVFDGEKALNRWIKNYADNHGVFVWSSDWYVVTRDGRRWKIESGNVNSDKATTTIYADPRAPEPPMFEFRPPKPEPVKMRERSIEPQRVPSALEYIEHMLSYSERQELHHRLREMQRRRQPIRRLSAYIRWDRPDDFMSPIAEPPSMYMGQDLSERELMGLVHAILDRRFRERPPMQQPVRPPPPPTRRNQ